MTKLKPRVSLVTFVVYMAISIFLSVAKAETVFLAEAPSSTISVAEAVKLAASKKLSWKCESIKTGPSGNPVKVPGSKPVWSSADTLKGIENPFERLASGEKTYRCSQMEANMENGRLKKAL